LTEVADNCNYGIAINFNKKLAYISSRNTFYIINFTDPVNPFIVSNYSFSEMNVAEGLFLNKNEEFIYVPENDHLTIFNLSSSGILMQKLKSISISFYSPINNIEVDYN
jgi:hypothetical protein